MVRIRTANNGPSPLSSRSQSQSQSECRVPEGGLMKPATCHPIPEGCASYPRERCGRCSHLPWHGGNLISFGGRQRRFLASCVHTVLHMHAQ